MGERTRSLRRAAALLVALATHACGGPATGPLVLTWYVNPDNGGQRRLAERCSIAAGGAYRLDVQMLPASADSQREQLVRRLASRDRSIDLMSLDAAFVAEVANAGFVLPIENAADRAYFTDGVLEVPRANAEWAGRLVAPPLWANTQVLWFRKSVATAAGIDPTRGDVTWDRLVEAAVGQGRVIAAQGGRYEGYVVWINALVESAGGRLLDDAAAGAAARPAIASPAGDRAARIVGHLARSAAAPADLATATEEEARATFQSARGAFMVNWPYVWTAMQDAVRAGALDPAVLADVGWARYPRAVADRASRPPFGGIHLAIGAFTLHPAEALQALRCLTSPESQVAYMLDAGNPAARAAAYDDPAVRARFPMAALIRESLADAAPRPRTPYWVDVSAAIQRTWHPPASVTSPRTPAIAADLVRDALASRVLL